MFFLDIELQLTIREETAASFTVIWPIKDVEASLISPLYTLFYRVSENDSDFTPISLPVKNNVIRHTKLNANTDYVFYVEVTDSGNTYWSNIIEEKKHKVEHS